MTNAYHYATRHNSFTRVTRLPCPWRSVFLSCDMASWRDNRCQSHVMLHVCPSQGGTHVQNDMWMRQVMLYMCPLSHVMLHMGPSHVQHVLCVTQMSHVMLHMPSHVSLTCVPRPSHGTHVRDPCEGMCNMTWLMWECNMTWLMWDTCEGPMCNMTWLMWDTCEGPMCNVTGLEGRMYNMIWRIRMSDMTLRHVMLYMLYMNAPCHVVHGSLKASRLIGMSVTYEWVITSHTWATQLLYVMEWLRLCPSSHHVVHVSLCDVMTWGTRVQHSTWYHVELYMCLCTTWHGAFNMISHSTWYHVELYMCPS